MLSAKIILYKIIFFIFSCHPAFGPRAVCPIMWGKIHSSKIFLLKTFQIIEMNMTLIVGSQYWLVEIHKRPKQKLFSINHDKSFSLFIEEEI